MKTTSMGLLTTLALTFAGTLLATPSAQAANYDAQGQDAATTAKVLFKPADTNPEKPQVPGTDPENPETPGDNQGTESEALLKITYLSDMDFGEQKVDKMGKNINAKLIDTSAGNKIAPYMQISDMRGTAAGWHLKVSQDGEFKTKDDAQTPLLGSYISFGKAKVMGFDGQELTNGVTSYEQKLNAGNGDSTIMNAEVGAGQGTTFGQFGTPDTETNTTDGVTMNAQTGVTPLAKEYEVTLNWKLEAAPI